MSLEEILPNIYKQKVVGSLLRYLRKEKCASARHLAEASSTSVSYYYEIENGAKHISEGKILEIMAIMKEHFSFTENADLRQFLRILLITMLLAILLMQKDVWI